MSCVFLYLFSGGFFSGGVEASLGGAGSSFLFSFWKSGGNEQAREEKYVRTPTPNSGRVIAYDTYYLEQLSAPNASQERLVIPTVAP